MILLYRLAHNDINFGVNFFDYFSYPTYTSTRGHHFKLSKPYATTRARLNFFATRTIDAWNSLPHSVVDAQTINTFKILLDNYYSNQMFVIDF